MKCPKCKNIDTKVVDSRIVEQWQIVRRRRECEFCSYRFTTFERIGVTELMVIKRDQKKELYDKSKLKKAIMLAFAKRNISMEDIDLLISNLEVDRLMQGNEIQSTQIGDDILEAIKQLDPVAYVRFASVYKSFDSFEDFKYFIE